jgi:hypothetical protein
MRPTPRHYNWRRPWRDNDTERDRRNPERPSDQGSSGTDFHDLQPGQVVHETYAINIGNGSSGWTEQDVVITLSRPENDAPEIAGGAQTTSLSVDPGHAAGGEGVASGAINFTDGNWYDHHTASDNFVFADSSGNAPLGAFTEHLVSDTAQGGNGGQFAWNYAVSDAILAAIPDGTTVREAFDVAIADDHGAIAHQQVIVNLSHYGLVA